MFALRLSDFSTNSLEIEIDFPRAVWNNSVAEWDAGMEGSDMSNSLIRLSDRADWVEVLETERIRSILELSVWLKSGLTFHENSKLCELGKLTSFSAI